MLGPILQIRALFWRDEGTGQGMGSLAEAMGQCWGRPGGESKCGSHPGRGRGSCAPLEMLWDF